MIHTDVFVDYARRARRRRSRRCSRRCSASLFFGLIVWGSYEPALHAWMSGEFEGEGALRVPVWPARIVVLLGARFWWS